MPLSISSAYPQRVSERDRWILRRRGARNAVDPLRAVEAFVEEERTERGDVVPVATLFLANRECPWRCLMCDLWKNTTRESAPAGAIPVQIRRALAELPPTPRVKLYNAGSFFDPKAIAPGDHPQIASLLAGFERVVVESHPALITESCRVFRDRLKGDLEVAMGLETAHPEALRRLNKRMTLGDFRRAADRLAADRIALRVFVLLGLPFLSAEEALLCTYRSIETAFDAGATAVSIIPTRGGNGALDELQKQGEFAPPSLKALEEAAAFGMRLARGRVFADLWDLERLRSCAACFAPRTERLRSMNRMQQVPPRVACSSCGDGP